MHEGITFRRLERFLAVMTAGSVRQAAANLQYSYQTLSADITALEKALGLTLFEPTRGSGSPPTPAGRLLESRVRALMEAGERAEAFAKSLREGRTGVLSIAAYPVHLERFLAVAIARFTEINPDVSVDLSKVRDDRRRGLGRSLFEELMAGDVDMAMGPPHHDLKGVTGIKAYDARIVVLFPPDDPLATAAQVSIEELQGRDLLTAPRTFFSREKLEVLAAKAGFALKVVYEGSSPPAIRALGIAGWGTPVLPDDYAIVGANPGRHHPVLIDKQGHEVSTPVWLHWRDQPNIFNPIARFIEIATDLAKEDRRRPGAAAVTL